VTTKPEDITPEDRAAIDRVLVAAENWLHAVLQRHFDGGKPTTVAQLLTARSELIDAITKEPK
jgi:hypothetical protein